MLDKAVDVFLAEFAVIRRCYVNKLPLDDVNFNAPSRLTPPTLTLVWAPDHAKEMPSVSVTYELFTTVEVNLTPFTNNQLKINCDLVRTSEAQ